MINGSERKPTEPQFPTYLPAAAAPVAPLLASTSHLYTYFNLTVEIIIFRQGRQHWEDVKKYWDCLGGVETGVTPEDFPAPRIKHSAKATRDS
jgi:hypothetical protein